MAEMPEILQKAFASRASDIIIVPDEPPFIRIDGRIQKMEGMPSLPAAEAKRIIYSILSQRQIAQFEKTGEVDMPLQVPGVTRFRVNVFLQQRGVACALRPLATKIPTPQEIALDDAIIRLAELPRGLVLIAGPTGSGKTTTLATMIQHINTTMKKPIITIEDPVEFVYQNQSSMINQREVGTHTMSFANALRAALRENPDVILVGEMRDLETIELAIKAAETGHLCFSTLHTKDAASTIDRVVSEFPAVQQPKAKLALSTVLCGVVSQVLVPKKGGGRVCAREIMLMNASISSLIREGKLHQISGAIQSARDVGMRALDQSLAELVVQKHIDTNMAYEWSSDPNTLSNILSNVAVPSGPVEMLA